MGARVNFSLNKKESNSCYENLLVVAANVQDVFLFFILKNLFELSHKLMLWHFSGSMDYISALFMLYFFIVWTFFWTQYCFDVLLTIQHLLVCCSSWGCSYYSHCQIWLLYLLIVCSSTFYETRLWSVD